MHNVCNESPVANNTWMTYLRKKSTHRSKICTHWKPPQPTPLPHGVNMPMFHLSRDTALWTQLMQQSRCNLHLYYHSRPSLHRTPGYTDNIGARWGLVASHPPAAPPLAPPPPPPPPAGLWLPAVLRLLPLAVLPPAAAAVVAAAAAVPGLLLWMFACHKKWSISKSHPWISIFQQT